MDARGPIHPEQPEDGFEEEDERAGTVSIRPVVIIGSLLLLALIGYLGYSCAATLGGSANYSAPVSRFAPNSVTYLAGSGTYLVRLADGSFLALSEAEATSADRVAGCVIRYRPDLSAGGQQGVFRGDCHGTLYNRMGIAVQGSALPMQRHPVNVRGNQVIVMPKQCLQSGTNQPQACRLNAGG